MKMACKYGNNKVQRWPIKPIITVFTDGLSDPSCRRRRITTHPPYGAHSSTADQALNVATRAFTSPHNPVRPYASLRVATHAYASPHTPPPPSAPSPRRTASRRSLRVATHAYTSLHKLVRRHSRFVLHIPPPLSTPSPRPTASRRTSTISA